MKLLRKIKENISKNKLGKTSMKEMPCCSQFTQEEIKSIKNLINEFKGYSH